MSLPESRVGGPSPAGDPTAAAGGQPSFLAFVPSGPGAGWYPDPADTRRERYWDGWMWTQQVRWGPSQNAGVSPLVTPQPGALAAPGGPASSQLAPDQVAPGQVASGQPVPGVWGPNPPAQDGITPGQAPPGAWGPNPPPPGGMTPVPKVPLAGPDRWRRKTPKKAATPPPAGAPAGPSPQAGAVPPPGVLPYPVPGQPAPGPAAPGPAAIVTGKPDVKDRNPGIDASVKFAGWGRRLLSGVIDLFLALLLGIVVLLLAARPLLRDIRDGFTTYVDDVMTASQQTLFPTVAPPETLVGNISSAMLILSAMLALYTAIFLGTWSATPGLRIAGLKVVKLPVLQIMQYQLAQAQGTNPAVKPATMASLEKVGWLRAISKGIGWGIFSYGGSLFILLGLVNAFMPLLHRRKQSLTDVFAGTLTINVRGYIPPPVGDETTSANQDLQ